MRTTRLLLLAAITAGAAGAVPASSAPPAATCLVISDSQGDPTEIQSPDQARAAEEFGDTADPATDIRAVRLGTSEDHFVAEVRVADSVRHRDAPGVRWTVAWRNATGEIAKLIAERATNGKMDYTFDRNGDSGAASGPARIDPRWDVVRVTAPAALLGIRHGDRLTEIQASTVELTGPAERSRDLAPDETDYGVAYVAGVECVDQDVRACPVVRDRAHDAGTLARVAKNDVPESPRTLDLLSTGATSSPEVVSVSARLVDPTAATPEGYSAVGWTMSWWDGARHWYAQAKRASSGMRYTFGIDGSDGMEPTGYAVGGLETTGRLRDKIVEVDVPRAVLGSPVDGTLWKRFAATSWALSDTDADHYGLPDANPFRVFDETMRGRWRVGVACGA